MSKSYKNSQLYKAFYFAYKAHGNQKRKYTGDPYMMHPLAVAQIVKDYGGTGNRGTSCRMWCGGTVQQYAMLC